MRGDSEGVGESVELGEEDRDIRRPSQLVQVTSQEGGDVVVCDAESLASGVDEPLEVFEHIWVNGAGLGNPVEGRPLVLECQVSTLTGSGVAIVVDEEVEPAGGNHPVQRLPVATIELNCARGVRHDGQVVLLV